MDAKYSVYNFICSVPLILMVLRKYSDAFAAFARVHTQNGKAHTHSGLWLLEPFYAVIYVNIPQHTEIHAYVVSGTCTLFSHFKHTIFN